MSLEEKMETLEEYDHGNGVENMSKWLQVEIVGMSLLQPKTQGTVHGNWEKPCFKLKWCLVLYHTYTSQDKFTTRYTSIYQLIHVAKLSKRSREYNLPSIHTHTFSSLQPNEKGKTHTDELFNNI